MDSPPRLSGDPLERALGELTRLLLSEETLDHAMHRIAGLAVSSIPACDTCSVSVLEDNRVQTQVSTDALAEWLDLCQYEHGSGPCLEAIASGEHYTIESMAEETRWPGFTADATKEGVRSSYSVPLKTNGRTVGALNLYSLASRFQERDQQASQAFGHQAAVALANAQAYQRAQDLVENLQAALESRDIIGQAKGIIMERERCTADRAFDILRSVSQTRNTKLRDLAQRVVETGTWTDVEA